MTSENQVQLIKRAAPYLDTHVLLHFLKMQVPGTERLQEQIAEIRETLSLFSEEEEEYTELENELDIISEQINQLNN